MNNSKQEREDIINENNTAQQQLTDILTTYNKQTDILNVNELLYGDIDLTILREQGFQLVKKVFFHPGKITNIRNVPKGITVLECDNNSLLSIQNLPGSLERLSISNNILETVTIDNLSKLTYINISHNNLSQIENLPSNIEELICEYNRIGSLDLTNLNKLKILNVSNNIMTVIEGMTENVVDFKMEHNPSISFRNTNTTKIADKIVGYSDNQTDNTEYNDALKKYFLLKQNYETKELEMKRKVFKEDENKRISKQKIAKIKTKCIKCKRPVGTLFGKKDKVYSAICGDSSSPCELDIQLFSGQLHQFIDLYKMVNDEFNESKDNIIIEKLNTLFNYSNEEDSVKRFAEQLKLFNDFSQQQKDFIDKYKDIYENDERMLTINKNNDKLFKILEQKNKLLDEYKQTNNKEFLKSAIDLHINSIKPIVGSLRLNKHHIMEMLIEEKYDEDGMIMKVENSVKIKSLFQSPVSLSEISFPSGEQPRVIKFVV